MESENTLSLSKREKKQCNDEKRGTRIVSDICVWITVQILLAIFSKLRW